MTIEYGDVRARRNAAAAERRRRAYPSAGPVTITRADGTQTVEPAQPGGDRPDWRPGARRPAV